MNIKELKEHLADYADETPCAYALWLPDDVHDVAMQLSLTVTDEDVADVLEAVHHHHDANLGITWETLRSEVLDHLNP